MVIISRASHIATITLASLISICAISLFDTVAFGNPTDDATVAEKYISMEEAPCTTDESIIVAQVVDVKITDDEKIRVGLTEEYLDVNYSKVETDASLSVTETDEMKLSVKEIVDNVDKAQQKIEEEAELARLEQERLAEEARKAELAKRSYSTSRTQGGLLDIQSPDSNYTSKVVKITGNDRDILERLVMGEAGNQGFEGAALVAQCIKDMYLLGNYNSIESVRVNCGYSGSLKRTPNKDVLDAVTYIFDEGGYAVKHRILYFYSPANMKNGYSKFHESQNNVINYGGHKFFDRW